jgi:hypothetical protein
MHRLQYMIREEKKHSSVRESQQYAGLPINPINPPE